MNEHYNRRSACDGKMKHSTELAVQYHIHENDKAGVEDYYLCNYCENYHTFTIPGMKKLSNKKHFQRAERRDKMPVKKMRLKAPKTHKNKRK